jgi:hypothetical protein
LNLKEAYEAVTKKTVPAAQKYLIFEVILVDLDTDDEIEGFPIIRVKLL